MHERDNANFDRAKSIYNFISEQLPLREWLFFSALNFYTGYSRIRPLGSKLTPFAKSELEFLKRYRGK